MKGQKPKNPNATIKNNTPLVEFDRFPGEGAWREMGVLPKTPIYLTFFHQTASFTASYRFHVKVPLQVDTGSLAFRIKTLLI